MPTAALRLVLGDQLSPHLTALHQADRAHDIVLMMEVADETRYVRHHQQKVALVLAAMRAFADRLRADGWTVDYIKLDDPANTGSFTGELLRAIERHAPQRIITTEASEHRVRAMQSDWAQQFGLPVEIRSDRRFLIDHAGFAAWAQGRKQLRMEYFYRQMRVQTGLLMDGDQPVGGQWNFDHDNRKPANADLFMPKPLQFAPCARTREVLQLVAQRCGDHVGALEPFQWAVTHEQAEQAAEHFFSHALPRFGDFQDAMLDGERYLYHSVLSPMLNLGLLDPLQLCQRAETEYLAGRAPLNAVEGFIRQIIGWREYVRGIYWLQGPDYLHRNALDARRPLPALYWTGQTRMRCMAQAIGQTLSTAYAHHIQRLMITGNFALLAGIDPHELHTWYLAVYADAYEWVEAPNTLGMSQFADGGLLGSKPYAASGAYIDRMSDYCDRCSYKVKQRTGPDACPFNALYWDFIARHRARFERNPRMATMYRTYDRFEPAARDAITQQAAGFLARLQRDGTDA